MERYLVGTLFIAGLLTACSNTATTQPSPTAMPTNAPAEESLEALPESDETPNLIPADVADYLPAVEDFQEPYLLSGFPATNETIVENWGTEYQAILDETGRSEGFIGLYDLEPTEMVAPPRLMVVVERFESIDGAIAFIDYNFPDGFRGGIYNGETIELGSAERALLATIENPNGDDPNGLNMTIAFQYRNINVIVEGQGTVDDVYEYYLERIALSILDKLEIGF